jgi:transcription termination factor NusB
MSQQNNFPAARLLSFQVYFYANQSDQKIDLNDESFMELRETIETPDEESDKLNQNPEVLILAKHILNYLFENDQEVRLKVNNSLHHKNINKLSKTDFALIMLGTSELIQNKGEDSKSIINSYVNISKRYGTKDSYSLINAVLDNVSRAN